jgi:ketosteroid isomerase-like protein
MPTSSLAASASLLALAGGSVPAANAAGRDVADLIAADQRMQHAFVTRDLAALREIFTEDYVLVVSSGAERNKATVLAEVESPQVRWEINRSSGWAVRVHGDCAIVVATLHQKGLDHGKPFDSHVKYSDTWIRDHGRWRNVHAHASLAEIVQS